MAEKYLIEHIVYVPEGESFLEWITHPTVKNFFNQWRNKDNLEEINNISKIYAEYNLGLGMEELLDKARIKKFKENTEIFYLCIEVDINPQKYHWRRIEDNYFPDWFKKTSIFNEYF